MRLIGESQIGREPSEVPLPLSDPVERLGHPDPIAVLRHGNPELTWKRPAQPIRRHPEFAGKRKQPTRILGQNRFPGGRDQSAVPGWRLRSPRSHQQSQKLLGHRVVNVPTA